MIDTDVTKYKTKKPSSTSKASSKAKHKHMYSPCKLTYTECYSIPGKTTKVCTFQDLATYCTVCGKIGYRSFLHSVEDHIKFDQENPDAPIFEIKTFSEKFVECLSKD